MLSFILLCVIGSVCSQEFSLMEYQIEQETGRLENKAQTILKEVDNSESFYKNLLHSMKKLKGTEHDLKKWFSERREENIGKICLSAKRNLEMIESHSNETTVSCYSRIRNIIESLKNKAKKVKEMVKEGISSCHNLTAPCKEIEQNRECLAKVWEHIREKLDTMKAAVKRFNIFQKLREFEAELSCKLCQQVSNSYSEAEKHEVDIIHQCIEDEKFEVTSMS